MDNEREGRLTFRQILFLITYAVLLFALMNHLSVVIKIAKKIISLVTPVFIGACIAFIFNVPMAGFERILAKLQTRRGKPVKERLNSIISLIVTLLLTAFLIYIIIIIVVPQTVESSKSIAALVRRSYPKLLSFLESKGISTELIRSYISKIDFNSIFDKLSFHAGTIVSTTVNAASTVVRVLVFALTGFVFSIYILLSKKKLGVQATKLLYAYTGEKFADTVCYVAHLSFNAFSNFISGQCLECIILGLLFFTVMTVIGLPYASVISVLIAATAIIPYVGAFIGCAVGAVLIFMVDPTKAIIFIVTFFILQQVENQLIYPRVVGSSVGLPAMWTLAAVLIGGDLFGIAGMVFFIPLSSVIYTLLRQSMNKRLKKKNITIK